MSIINLFIYQHYLNDCYLLCQISCYFYYIMDTQPENSDKDKQNSRKLDDLQKQEVSLQKRQDGGQTKSPKDNLETVQKQKSENIKEIIQDKEPVKKKSQQSEEESIQRANVKNIKKNKVLISKYKDRSKNTSRNLDPIQNSFNSTNNLKRPRKLSSAMKNHDQSEEGVNNQSQVKEGHQIDYKQQNRKLRSKTAFLMEELKKIQAKLTKQLSRRGSPKRQNRAFSLQNVSNKQVLNADKRCRIYLKDIQTLKQKTSIFTQEKVNHLTDEVKNLKQANNQLETDRKQLKRKVKNYERMISQIGDGDYLKMKQQNQNLRSQNQKLRSKIKKQQQEQRIQKVSASNQKNKSKKQNEKQQQQKKKQQQKQQKQINILKSKSQRDDKKLKSLTFENNKNKEKIQQIQNQLKEKNKQIQMLKERLSRYSRVEKKKQKLKQKEKDTKEQNRQENQNEDNNKSRGKKNKNSNDNKNKTQAKKSQQLNKSQVSKQQENSEKQNKNSKQKIEDESPEQKKQEANQGEQKAKSKKAYPKKKEIGESSSQSIKWNHYPFSSKIKQIQVMPHKNGHVRTLNFRYEKGQPQKLETGTYASFVCEENTGEYITCISGGFLGGFLQFVKVQTSKSREASFCKRENSDECKLFQFKTEKMGSSNGEGEYISAVFGENNNQGVIRLGCFIDISKQK